MIESTPQQSSRVIQVAGHLHGLSAHPTIGQTPVIVKRCREAEHTFYELMENHRRQHEVASEGQLGVGTALSCQNMSADICRALRHLQDWAPLYFGVLQATDNSAMSIDTLRQAAGAENIFPGDYDDPSMRHIVLENLVEPFLHPSIMDVKLGTILFAHDASPDKIERATRRAKERTSQTCGMSIVGLQRWNPCLSTYEQSKKVDLHALKERDLLSVFRNFLPSFRTKNYVTALRAELQSLIEDLEKVNWRWVSGSLLIVVEGDEEASAKAWSLQTDHANRSNESIEAQSPTTSEDEEDEEHVDPKFLTIRLIDFAHVQWTPGQGPDQGVLQGCRYLLNLIEKV